MNIINETFIVPECPCCGYKEFEFWKTLENWTLDKCDNCGLVFVNPMPTEKALQTAYALPEQEYIKYFQCEYVDLLKISDGSAEWQYETSKNYLKTIETIVGRKGSILEIGCGSGAFLETAYNRGWKTAGVEMGTLSENNERDNELCIYRGSLSDAGFEPGIFDVVFMGSVLEHLPHPKKYLDYLYNLLKKNGIIYIVGLPNMNSITIKLGVDKWRGNHPPAHLLYFKRKSVKIILKRVGFEKINIKSYGMPETILEKIFNKKNKKYTGEYAGYIHKKSIKGLVLKIIRKFVYAIFNYTDSGSVLEVYAEKM